jgi:broad specificity phosphatase PhoE
MSDLRLLLIRHAETTHNRDSRVQGQADIPLSETGERQAMAVGEALRDIPLAAVVSSPLGRARVTADAVASPHDLTVTPEPALMEMHVGEMEGLSTAEMRAGFPDFLKEWATERGPSLLMPGGESLEQVRDRAWAVVERLRERYDGQTVALVSHNFVLSCLICRALELPLHQFRRFRLSVAGITTLQFRADRTILVRLNDTCHLTRAGLPVPDPWPARRD